jgi:hypothetical protein
MESCKCNPGAGGDWKEFEFGGDEDNNILNAKVSFGLR